MNRRICNNRATDERLEQVIAQVVQLTGVAEVQVRPFVEQYNRSHAILDSPADLAHQFVALKETAHINDIRVLCEPDPSEPDPNKLDQLNWKITVSAASATTRTVLARSANYFGLREINIEKAVLENVVRSGFNFGRVANFPCHRSGRISA